LEGVYAWRAAAKLTRKSQSSMVLSRIIIS
jgi:hypothetical protein